MTDDGKQAGGAAPFRDRARSGFWYGLSLPERALRSTAGVVGGTLRESAAVALPDAVRNAKTYQVFVGQLLDFMAEDVGGAGGGQRVGTRPDDFLARKTVGNFIDVAGLATVHLSPLLLLAVVSDVAYGSQTYLREVAEEMQRQGVIEDAAKVRRVDDLLDQIADFSSRTAAAFDQPPLSVEGLRETVRQTREALTRIDIAEVLPAADLRSLWNDLHTAARRQGVSPFRLSGLVTLASLDKVGKLGSGALSSVQVAGTLLNRHVLAHYRDVLASVERRGFYASLAESSRPYLQAAWGNFSPQRRTITEEFLRDGGVGRVSERAADKLRRWLSERRANR